MSSVRGITGVAAVAVVGAGLTATGVASASGISVTSGRLGTAALPAPPFHPTGVGVTTQARGGSAPDRGDVITVTFSRPVLASTVCAGPPDTPLTGFTVTVTDNGTANDTLTLSHGPTGCPTPRFGILDLGTPGYLASGLSQFTNSTVNVVTDPPSITITLGSKVTTKLTDVAEVTPVRLIPDPALQDREGNRVRGTATDAVDF